MAIWRVVVQQWRAFVWRRTRNLDDPIIDDLIRAGGVRWRRFEGHDDLLRRASQERRASADHLRHRARIVESGAAPANEFTFRRIK